MSKAFTKDDASDEPVLVPPRAPLPAGVPNYVTPRGLASLRAELGALVAERTAAEHAGEGPDRVRTLGALHTRVRDLEERVASAVLVDPAAQPRDVVRFGAVVTAAGEDGAVRTYEIVGVDEAAPAEGRIAFVAPLARALLGKGVGDVATVRTPRGDEEIEVRAIAYEAQ